MKLSDEALMRYADGLLDPGTGLRQFGRPAHVESVRQLGFPFASIDGVNNGAVSGAELKSVPAVTAFTFTTFVSNFKASKATTSSISIGFSSPRVSKSRR